MTTATTGSEWEIISNWQNTGLSSVSQLLFIRRTSNSNDKTWTDPICADIFLVLKLSKAGA